MDESLSLMLKRSEQMATDLSALFQDGLQPEFPRTLLTIAMCQVAMEHAESQRVLIRAGCDVTALSLVRLQFEALVRAIWLHHGATDEWIAGFSAPMEPTQLAEPIGSPPVDSMLQKLDSTAPPFVVKMLRDFKTSTWAPMNSYVHGGVRAVVQSLAGCKPSQLIDRKSVV